MGCTSSRANVKSDKKSKKKLVAPELLLENYLTSSLMHTHEPLNPKLHRRSSISEVRENIPRMRNTLPMLEFPEKLYQYDRTPYPRPSEETVANFVRENKSTIPKIGTISDPRKLTDAAEVIDVGELMKGLEDAADLSCSSFGIHQTSKIQTTHSRSTSLSVIPSRHDSKLSVDSESRKLLHSESRSHHQRVKSYSPIRDYEMKDFSTIKDSSGETVCKDVTAIEEVLERSAGIKSTSEGLICKKLFDNTNVGRLDSSMDSDKIRKSEVSYDQIDFSVTATDQTSHRSKTLCSTPSFDFKSFIDNFSTDDDIHGADAVNEFSFNTQILQKGIAEIVAQFDLEDDVDSGKTTSETLFKEPSSVDSFSLFRSVSLQSMNNLKLNDFERLTPPRGENTIVLYATSSNEQRKTYEDCSLVRQILHSYDIDLDERDILLHPELNHELQQIMKKTSAVSVPRLFIKGRHIGGAKEVCILHKAKALGRLLQVFSSEYIKALCVCCGGNRTIQCLGCNGMCWLKTEENDIISCYECEKKGWITCPICSFC